MRRGVVIAVGGLLLALAAPPGAGQAAAPAATAAATATARSGAAGPGDAAPIPGSLLVTTRTRADAAALVAGLRGALPGVPGPLAVEHLAWRVVAVRVAPGAEAAAAGALQGRPGVTAVEPDRWMALQRMPDDPRYPDQWAHRRTGAEDAWDVTTGDPDVRVAVIDSGMLGTHPDLAPNIETQVSSTQDPVVVTGARVLNDPCGKGHGTFVGGILAARGDDGLGVAGAAWDVSLMDISALSTDNCDGLADSAILRGLRYAADNADGPVDVVNMSFGRPADRCPATYQATLADVRAAGVVVVAAAGNGEAKPETAGKPMIPASCDGVISVAASRQDDSRAAYSSSNPFVDLTAPGGDTADGLSGLILSTAMDSQGRAAYGRQAGTSHAAPYVSAAAALLRAARPSLSPAQVESALERSAKDLARPGRDNGTGWGLVRMDAALDLADGSVPAPEPDPAYPVDATTQPWSPPKVARVAAQGTITAPVTQAVAVSKTVFDANAAAHAALARDDDFADALAGSALGSGLGPLLFTGRTGALAGATRTELSRALPDGATVYLLGGPAALPPTLEDELRGLGLVPVRLSGSSREQTAAAIAGEVDRRNLRALRGVLLARSDQWPDAVAGGSLAAWFGMPVLLTPPAALHPAAAEALGALRPDRVYALGGTAAIAPEVLDAAGTAAGLPSGARRRLSGPGRAETAVAIATEMEALLREQGDAPGSVLAVNLRRADGFTHALSASALSGATGAVMIPVEGTNGQTLPAGAREYVRGIGVDGLLVGGADVVSATVGEELEELLRG